MGACVKLFVFLCYVMVVRCFLLQSGSQSALNNMSSITHAQYSNLLELLMDERQHRHDLQQRVASLEQAVASKQNDGQLQQLQQHVVQLEDKVNDMKQRMATSINETVGSTSCDKIVNDSLAMRAKFDEHVKKYNNLLKAHEMTSQTLHQLQTKVVGLEQLKNVNQLQSFQSLEQTVQSLSSKTNMLISTSSARGQDFMALYNQTIASDNHLKNLIDNVQIHVNNKTATLASDINGRLFDIEKFQNETDVGAKKRISDNENAVNALQTRIHTLNAQMNVTKHTSDSRSRLLEMKVTEMGNRQNRTNKDILTKIADNSREVAVASCLLANKAFSSGNIIIFSNVKMSSGVSNLSAFKSTGKFTCEYPGLYHVTATMTTYPSEIFYGFIMKNNAAYITLYDEYSRGTHTSTAATTLTLATNDTVYFKSSGSFTLYGYDWSCMSITKIK